MPNYTAKGLIDMKNFTSKRIYNHIIDLLFPAKCIFCGEKISSESEIFTCVSCMLAFSKPAKDCCYPLLTAHDSYVIAPLEYKGNVRRAIYNFKFRSRPHYAKTLAYFINYSLADVLKDNSFDIITYVPAGRRKLKKRGYNPAELIAKNLEIPNALLRGDILKRVIDGTAQSLKDSSDRINSAYKNFSYVNTLNGKTVLLVDDICTTGATLDSCVKNLLAAGAQKVVCVAAAKTPLKYKPADTQLYGARLMPHDT